VVIKGSKNKRKKWEEKYTTNPSNSSIVEWGMEDFQ
jgi:hypothetical protein